MEVEIERMEERWVGNIILLLSAIKHSMKLPMRGLSGLSHGQLGWVSLSWNWLTSKVSVHWPCKGQANALQMPKANSQMIKSHFHSSWHFYIPHKVIQGRIHSNRLPPPHPWCLVTSMPLDLFLNPSSSTQFEWLPPSPKCVLLEAIFIPDMSGCHRSAIRFDLS